MREVNQTRTYDPALYYVGANHPAANNDLIYDSAFPSKAYSSPVYVVRPPVRTMSGIYADSAGPEEYRNQPETEVRNRYNPADYHPHYATGVPKASAPAARYEPTTLKLQDEPTWSESLGRYKYPVPDYYKGEKKRESFS